MRRVDGVRLLTWVGRAAIRRHHQLLPRFGEKKLVIERGPRQYLVRWTKWEGYCVIASRFTLPGVQLPIWLWLDSE